MASWTQPKMDWKSTDYFNIEDYNRIVGNLIYIEDMARQLFQLLEIQQMEEEKNYYSMFYASEMNAIENNLHNINLSSYNFNIGDKKEYYPNNSTPLYTEYNRIESATLKLFYALYGQLSILKHMEFRLNGQKPLARRVRYVKDEIIAHRLRYRLGTNNGGKF